LGVDVAVGSVLIGNRITLSYPRIESRSAGFCVRESDFPDTFVVVAARLALVAVFGVDDEPATPPLELLVSAPLCVAVVCGVEDAAAFVVSALDCRGLHPAAKAETIRLNPIPVLFILRSRRWCEQ
jgi:hypothetical protein